MKTNILFMFMLIAIVSLQACSKGENASGSQEPAVPTAVTGDKPLPPSLVKALNSSTLEDTVVRSPEEWREELTPAEYEVLREDGTEIPFENEFNENQREGFYTCAACGNPMFSSATKFDSGTGWPSFYAPISEKRIKEEQDLSLGMVRTEVVCARCASHIGHVFPDGPEPTGLRYCLNSIALDFVET